MSDAEDDRKEGIWSGARYFLPVPSKLSIKRYVFLVQVGPISRLVPETEHLQTGLASQESVEILQVADVEPSKSKVLLPGGITVSARFARRRDVTCPTTDSILVTSKLRGTQTESTWREAI